jgi:hypothetical protein
MDFYWSDNKYWEQRERKSPFGAALGAKNGREGARMPGFGI